MDPPSLFPNLSQPSIQSFPYARRYAQQLTKSVIYSTFAKNYLSIKYATFAAVCLLNGNVMLR